MVVAVQQNLPYGREGKRSGRWLYLTNLASCEKVNLKVCFLREAKCYKKQSSSPTTSAGARPSSSGDSGVRNERIDDMNNTKAAVLEDDEIIYFDSEADDIKNVRDFYGDFASSDSSITSDYCLRLRILSPECLGKNLVIFDTPVTDVVIGKGVIMGENVTIFSVVYPTRTDLAKGVYGGRPVSIGDHARVGTGAVIM